MARAKPVTNEGNVKGLCRSYVETARLSMAFPSSAPFGGTFPQGKAVFQQHHAIVAKPGAFLNKGSRKPPSPAAERQRAGNVSTTTSLHPRRSNLHPASLPNGSPGSGPAGPALGSRTEPSEAGQCGRRRGKGMQQGIPCLQGVPCGMDFDPTSGTFHHWKVPRPQAKQPLTPSAIPNASGPRSWR